MATDGSARVPPGDSPPPPAAPLGDPRVARQADAALRLLAGMASPRAVGEARRAVAAGAGDDAVLGPLVADPVAVDDLLARGGRALRERLVRPAPARRRNAGKRLLAFLLVRGTFYLVMLALVLVLLVLLREYRPAARRLRPRRPCPRPAGRVSVRPAENLWTGC